MNAESIVRDQLLQELTGQSNKTPAVIDEFWIPISHERADLVFIQEGLHAFEIKTVRDSLARLSRQVQAYTRVFDTCTAVVAPRHAGEVCRVVPEWWGVWTIPEKQGVPFCKIRESKYNEFVDPETLVRLLWREEVKIAITGLGHPPSPGMGRLLMWETLLAQTSLDELKGIVVDFIQRRSPSHARIPTRRFSRAGAELRQLLSDDTEMM
jgi:hypothetical protein